MKRFLKGHAFDLCRPKSARALDAEAAYNNSVVVNDGGDKAALEVLVQEHTDRYPFGIDPQHVRNPNGHGSNDNDPPG